MRAQRMYPLKSGDVLTFGDEEGAVYRLVARPREVMVEAPSAPQPTEGTSGLTMPGGRGSARFVGVVGASRPDVDDHFLGQKYIKGATLAGGAYSFDIESPRHLNCRSNYRRDTWRF